MKKTITYTNEFTGEIFTDKEKCKQAEKESKKYFLVDLMGQIDRLKDICNSKKYCSECPFFNESCKISILADNYLDIVQGLHEII